MARLTREQVALGIIFLLVLGIRLAYTLPLDSYSYDAYFALRQADAIRHTGTPYFQDPLSYSGRTYLFPPLFEYVIALFALVFSVEVAAKLVTSLSFASITILAYLLSRQVTKNKTIPLVAALFTGFIPVMYFTTDSFSSQSLSLLLVFLLSYFFLRLDEEKSASFAVITSILLLLTSQDVFIFLFGLAFYFIILFLEKQKPTKREVELTVFLFFLAIWFNIILYKKALFLHGAGVLWSNMPSAILSTYFQDVSFVGILYSVGVIPLLLGIYAIYNLVFDAKNRGAHLFMGFAISSFLALWLKLVPLSTGLLFLSVNTIILSAYTMRVTQLGIAKTKMESLSTILGFIVVLLFLLTTMSPFFTYTRIEPQHPEDLKAMAWLKENTNEDAVVLAGVEEGFMLNYLAERRNVADSNFLFVKNANQVYEDTSRMYSLRLKSEAIRLINAYDVDYVLLSKRVQESRNMTSLFYEEGACIRKVYDKGAVIYELRGCKI
ncbi:glycosyltransferase family 39 protein [Candidatus Woesearchaeota archaeon]|nr:glycosyltransferase family 39 protein [Candidatus Woesearchaeota archaeon]